jgi:hypothetical protein
VLELARDMKSAEISQSVAEYLGIVGAFDALLAQQVELDLRSFERAQRPLSQVEWETARSTQFAATRFTFLGSGMTHPNFVGTLRQLGADAASTVLRAAQDFQ